MISTPTLLAIDQGTTSSRAMIFTAKGKIVGIKQKELKESIYIWHAMENTGYPA